jgi:hypothetical protein
MVPSASVPLVPQIQMGVDLKDGKIRKKLGCRHDRTQRNGMIPPDGQ